MVMVVLPLVGVICGVVYNMELFSELKETFDKIESLNFKWWLDFGQLLSAHRSGQLLSWDKDIDFVIQINDEKDYDVVQRIIRESFTRNFDWAVPNKMIKTKKHGFAIDFFLAYKRDKWIHLPTFRGGLDIRSFFVDELQTIKLNDFEFNCPRHLDFFQQIRYGDTWRTPIIKDHSTVNTNPGHKYQMKSFKCLTSGVFDVLHQGHINLFERCHELFDEVTIGIHNDKTVASYKRLPKNNQNKRFQDIFNLGYTNVLKDFPLIACENTLKDFDFVVFGREESCESFYPVKTKNHPVNRTPNISSSKIILNETSTY